MCWPELVGSVEVEERRPRTWNEPRRKRLNFVRGHQRNSDKWVSTPLRLTPQEIWDRRRARDMEEQRLRHLPHPQFHDPRMVQFPPGQQPWHQIQPGHHGHQPGFDQHDHHAHHGHHGQQPQLDRRSHHSDDDIIAIEDFGHDGHDGHDDHHPDPKIIHIRPPKSHLPKGLKAHAKKSGGHKPRYSVSPSSSDDSSISDGYSGFSEGFRAGRRSLSRRTARRGRSRSRLTDDSFEDLMRSRRGRP